MFLVFLYSILEPAVNKNNDKRFILDRFQSNLIEQVSANLTTVLVSSPGGTCLQIYDENVRVESGLNSIVKDMDGNILQSKREGNYLLMEDNNFLRVYYSEEEFDLYESIFINCIEPVIESIRSDEQIFETKIIEIENLYQTDYEGLKEIMEIPEGYGFDFKFIFEDGTTIGSGTEFSREVYVKEIPVSYVDKEAKILTGKFIIRVW